MLSTYNSKLLLICLVLPLLIACAGAPKKSLYERIGGMQVLTVVVDEAIDEVANSEKTNRTFEDINLIKLKESVVSQLCALTGGGCEYEGETMSNAHYDAQITQAEFEVFVSIFRQALSRHTRTREKNELLKILAPMKRDIVNQQSKHNNYQNQGNDQCCVHKKKAVSIFP